MIDLFQSPLCSWASFSFQSKSRVIVRGEGYVIDIPFATGCLRSLRNISLLFSGEAATADLLSEAPIKGSSELSINAVNQDWVR
jgi:hypothetical protein